MRREAIVGFVFTVAVVLLAGFVLYAGGFQTVGQVKHTIQTTFPNVAGLEVEDEVSLAGVVVGQVQAVRVDAAQVRVDMFVVADAPIKTDSVARLESESLLGGRRIDISLGSPDAPLAGAGAAIPGEAAADVDQLVENVNTMTKDVQRLVRQFESDQGDLFERLGATVDEAKSTFTTINRILGENEEGLSDAMASLAEIGPRLDGTLERLDDITRQIQSGDGTLGKLVYDSALHDEMLGLIDSLKVSSEKLGAFLEPGEGEAGGPLGAFADAAPQFKETMARLDRITAQLEAGEGTLGKLLTDDELYEEATRAMHAVGDAAENAREQGPISTFTGAVVGAATALN